MKMTKNKIKNIATDTQIKKTSEHLWQTSVYLWLKKIKLRNEND